MLKIFKTSRKLEILSKIIKKSNKTSTFLLKSPSSRHRLNLSEDLSGRKMFRLRENISIVVIYNMVLLKNDQKYSVSCISLNIPEALFGSAF